MDTNCSTAKPDQMIEELLLKECETCVPAKPKVAPAKINERQKFNNAGPVYRSLVVRELFQGVQEVFSQRKQLWMRITMSTLPFITLTPYAMPQWKWLIWASVIPTIMLFFFLWDYFYHIRHIGMAKRQQMGIIMKDDPYEKSYIITRPDMADYVAPYALYFLSCSAIIGAYHLIDIYQDRHGDSVLMLRLNGTEAMTQPKMVDARRTSTKS